MNNSISLGTLLPMQLRNEKICLTKTEKGIYAFQEKCPHNGALLSKGFCTKNNEIVCPIHRYSFDLSSGKATSGGALYLKCYPIETKKDGVYIGIEAKWWEF
ncbi:MAG: Rieske (2Fe-2S) protein [Bacteroidetes bacterium]|nr:Rieske (2Fe-2S) protein [Bacteroidota bacterium]